MVEELISTLNPRASIFRKPHDEFYEVVVIGLKVGGTGNAIKPIIVIGWQVVVGQIVLK